MTVSATAVLAILGIVGSFVDNSLVKRLLQGIAKKTPTKLDDLVVDILYSAVQTGAPEEAVEKKLDAVQAQYNAATPEERAELKAPSTRIRVEDGTIVADTTEDGAVAW